jgi:hypothetical protein
MKAMFHGWNLSVALGNSGMNFSVPPEKNPEVRSFWLLSDIISTRRIPAKERDIICHFEFLRFFSVGVSPLDVQNLCSYCS